MWEYKRKDVEFKLFSELTEIINKEGQDNWEIVYYEEEKPANYSGKFTAKILYKRLKEKPA